jgi:hypothetical protein
VHVELDLLATEFDGRGKKHEHQTIQDVKARKTRGSDLIFDDFNRFENVEIDGVLPNGAKDTVKCKVAGFVPFIVMKGMALGRGKPKDAYDIEYAIAHYPAGTTKLIDEFKKDPDNLLIRQGLGKIRTKFQTPEHTGPADIIQFLQIEGGDNQSIRRRAAFEVVSELLNALNIERVV